MSRSELSSLFHTRVISHTLSHVSLRCSPSYHEVQLFRRQLIYLMCETHSPLLRTSNTSCRFILKDKCQLVIKPELCFQIGKPPILDSCHLRDEATATSTSTMSRSLVCLSPSIFPLPFIVFPLPSATRRGVTCPYGTAPREPRRLLRRLPPPLPPPRPLCPRWRPRQPLQWTAAWRRRRAVRHRIPLPRRPLLPL